MKKLILIFVIAIFVFSLCFYFLFWGLQDKEQTSSEAIAAVPVDASFILKVNNYHRFSENLKDNNNLWKSFRQFTSVAKVDSIISFIDTLTFRSSAFNQLLTLSPVYISIHPGKNGFFDFFSTAKLSDGTSRKDLSKFISEMKGKKFKATEYKFKGELITSIVDAYSASELLSFTIYNGLAICSSSKSLVETSINQLNSHNSLASDPTYFAISQTAGSKVDANLFINNSKLPKTFQCFLKQPYRQGVNTLADIGLWSELDISLKEDAVFLNGFTQTAESSNNFLKVLTRQQPVENKIGSILPTETATFICLGISDLDKYLEDYRLYLDKTDHILDYTSALSDLKNSLGVDIHELYRSFFNKEIALVFASYDGVDYKDCWFTAVRTLSQSQALQTFTGFLDSYAKTNKLKKADFKTSLKIDNEKSADIYRSPVKGINKALFGSLFSDASDEFFTFIDDYIIFGASKDALSKFILSNIHNNQLQLDVSYREFSNILSSSSNYFLYLNPHKSEKLFSNLLDADYSAIISNNLAALNKVQGMAIQLNGASSMIFNNISFQYSPYTAEDPQTAWETRIDTSIVLKPQLVVNHITKNQEIIVQDVKNKIYLLNEIGRILWTKQLPEPIIGDITQVDLFRNSKLQYIFNTRSFLFAVDRRGSFVEGFPIKLKAPATNPVAIFDYDGDRDYRFFIACEDHKIYSYNSQGKSVPGWLFKKTERPVYNPLQHFRVKGKDYIVFADKNRPYILDRKGEERVSIPKYFSKSINSSFTLDESTKSHADRLITSDSVGLIKYIYFNGKVEDLAIKAFSSKHVFDYQDVDSDGEKEFLFLDKSQLYVYKKNKNLLFLYKFDAEIYPSILNFDFSKSNHYLGFTSSSSKKIYLINGQGSLYNGFPLVGSSLFSISNLSNAGVSFNVLVGSSSGLLLNYSVK